MATWTSPTTRTTGELITASIWNTLLGADGSLKYLYDNAAAGLLVQVVGASYATETSNATTTYADTGLTCNITPADNTNKVVCFFSLSGVYKESAPTALFTQFLRGATVLGSMRNLATSGSVVSGSVSFNYLDSPASASAQTYKAQFKLEGSGTVYVQQASSRSSVVLAELAAS